MIVCLGAFISRNNFIRNTVLVSSVLGVDNEDVFDYIPSNDIFLYEDITADSCLRVQKEMKFQENLSRNIHHKFKLDIYPSINLHIQSDGGTLSSALHLCDYIESFDIPIITYVEGCVSSAASLISVCGKKRLMNKRSALLIHEPTTELGTSGPNSLHDEAHNMDLLYNLMIDIYTSHSKLKSREIIKLIENERYLNASECLRFGFIDEII
tara:strand:+ start:514 stop:1146 length:633 start_codon:yes stop_codon:yes gene_type:complete